MKPSQVPLQVKPPPTKPWLTHVWPPKSVPSHTSLPLRVPPPHEAAMVHLPPVHPPLAQSLLPPQAWPTPQRCEHVAPPQSTSVSSLFFFWSLHVGCSLTTTLPLHAKNRGARAT